MQVTRSKEEAREMLAAFRQRIVSKEISFEELASVESDCSSAKRGGDLVRSRLKCSRLREAMRCGGYWTAERTNEKSAEVFLPVGGGVRC